MYRKTERPVADPSGNIADFAAMLAWMGGRRDETRNPLVVDFSESLRINRLTVPVNLRRRVGQLSFAKQNDTQLL